MVELNNHAFLDSTSPGGAPDLYKFELVVPSGRYQTLDTSRVRGSFDFWRASISSHVRSSRASAAAAETDNFYDQQLEGI